MLPSRRERTIVEEQLRRQEHVERSSAAQFRLRRKDDGTDNPDHAALRLDAPFHPGAAAELVRQAAIAEAQQGTLPWRRNTGFDELLTFWNNLPPQSEVELYVPALDVEYVSLLRTLRQAPRTVRSVDGHTPRLTVEGVTHLPIPNLGAERLAGLLTVRLPDTIKTGQTFTVDVLQVRSPAGIVVGAFQLMIPVTKAAKIWAREGRTLDVFEERLKLTPVSNRWHPILTRQVDYLRNRVRGLTAEAADECAQETDREKQSAVRLRVLVD